MCFLIPTDVQMLVVKEEKQEWSSSLDQEDPELPHIKEEQEDPEPPHIKEEQEELCTSQEAERLQRLEQADITEFIFTQVKSEDDEEEVQSSQLHQKQTELMEREGDGEDCRGPELDRNSNLDSLPQPDTHEKTEPSSEHEDSVDVEFWKETRKHQSGFTYQRNRKVSVDDGFKGNPPASRSTDHMKAEADGEDCGGREPDRNSGSDTVQGIGDSSEPETDDSDDWKKTKEPQEPQPGSVCGAGEKPLSCSECGKRFRKKTHLKIHLRSHTGEKPFSCSVCKKCFSQSGNLQKHMRIHTGEKLFSCSECGKRVGSQESLKKHKRVHTAERIFKCSVCCKRFPGNSHLAIHMRTHTGEKPFRCSVCGKRFSQRGIMSQHMAVHSGVKPFSCAVCGRRFFWHFQIKKHKCLEELCRFKGAVFNGGDCDREEAAGSSDPVRLPKPGTNKDTKPSSVEDSVDVEFWTETRKHQSGFTYQRNRKVSVNDGFKSSKTPFSCSDNRTEAEPTADDGGHGPKPLKGEQVFVGDPGFNSNMKPSSFSDRHRRSEDGLTLLTHGNSPVGGKPFGCLFCGKGSAMAGYLSRPIPIHIGERTLGCVICHKTFSPESDPLHVPIRLHTGLKPFGCSVCGRTFAERESLRSHVTCHTAEKPFSCSVCNTGCSDSEDLVQHMRVHTRQTQFSCTVCGKEFVPQSETRFTVTKPYTCSECGKRFHHNYNLRNHIKYHTGEKAFFCSICGLKCLYKSHLEIHMRTHTREKPFPCSVCGKRYAHKASMQSHMAVHTHLRIHTGEKPYRCSHCGRRFSDNSNYKRHVRAWPHAGPATPPPSVLHNGFSF
uniref:C2H2-type domain-containing protein n=1 Tax=Gasterosteus aculeatus aculeatus TaxID=481459 RepID=A0AAQ4QJG5_GASAC